MTLAQQLLNNLWKLYVHVMRCLLSLHGECMVTFCPGNIVLIFLPGRLCPVAVALSLHMRNQSVELFTNTLVCVTTRYSRACTWRGGGLWVATGWDWTSRKRLTGTTAPSIFHFRAGPFPTDGRTDTGQRTCYTAALLCPRPAVRYLRQNEQKNAAAAAVDSCSPSRCMR